MTLKALVCERINVENSLTAIENGDTDENELFGTRANHDLVGLDVPAILGLMEVDDRLPQLLDS